MPARASPIRASASLQPPQPGRQAVLLGLHRHLPALQLVDLGQHRRTVDEGLTGEVLAAGGELSERLRLQPVSRVAQPADPPIQTPAAGRQVRHRLAGPRKQLLVASEHLTCGFWRVAGRGPRGSRLRQVQLPQAVRQAHRISSSALGPRHPPPDQHPPVGADAPGTSLLTGPAAATDSSGVRGRAVMADRTTGDGWEQLRGNGPGWEARSSSRACDDDRV